MADEEKDESRSAADIVDDMADEMGIDEEEEPDSELSDEMKDELGGLFDEESESSGESGGDDAEQESASEEDEESGDQSSEDASASASDAAASDDADEDEKGASDTQEEGADEAEASSKESVSDDEVDEVSEAIEDEVAGDEADAPGAFGAEGDDQIGGVFDPDDEGTAESDAELGEDAYLDESDLEDYGTSSDYSTRTWALGITGGVVAFALFMLGYLVLYPDEMPRIEALARGELRAYEQFQAAQAQEEFEKKQLEKLPKFGTLSMNGRPMHSLIQLDGSKQYGKTSDGHWKAKRLSPGTKFRNLRVEEEHSVTVSNPSFKEKTWDLTPGHWEKKDGSQVEYAKMLTVALIPKSVKHHREFYQRLKKDPENNYFGKVTIETQPKGAKVIFDGEPLKNKEGEKLTTPVTFEKYWTKQEDKEDTDKDESKELKENKVKVDMPPDKGHKIVLKMPEDAGDYPSYVTPLERQMWTCNWKSDREIARLPDDASYPDRCNYTYNLDVNFSDLKTYIEKRKKERQRVKEQNEKIKETVKKSPGGPSS